MQSLLKARSLFRCGKAPSGDTDAVLRDFTQQDQCAVKELILDGLRERWGDAFDDAYNRDLDDIRGNYQLNSAEVVVAEVRGEIVATGMLLDEQEQGRIVRMSVASSHRRQGLATMVVLELVERARGKGFAVVNVRTDTPWTSAVGLYLSCGFDHVGSDATDTHFEKWLTAKPDHSCGA